MFWLEYEALWESESDKTHVLCVLRSLHSKAFYLVIETSDLKKLFTVANVYYQVS